MKISGVLLLVILTVLVISNKAWACICEKDAYVSYKNNGYAEKADEGVFSEVPKYLTPYASQAALDKQMEADLAKHRIQKKFYSEKNRGKKKVHAASLRVLPINFGS